MNIFTFKNYLFSLVQKIRFKFSKCKREQRDWLLRCKKNLSEGKECPLFCHEKNMKFLEQTILNFVEMRDARDEVLNKKDNVQSEDMEASDSLKDKLKVMKPVKNFVRFNARAISGREFMKEIEKHPIIYDINHPNYNNNNLTDKAWSEIASRFKMTGMFFCNIMFIYNYSFIFVCL